MKNKLFSILAIGALALSLADLAFGMNQNQEDQNTQESVNARKTERLELVHKYLEAKKSFNNRSCIKMEIEPKGEMYNAVVQGILPDAYFDGIKLETELLNLSALDNEARDIAVSVRHAFEQSQAAINSTVEVVNVRNFIPDEEHWRDLKNYVETEVEKAKRRSIYLLVTYFFKVIDYRRIRAKIDRKVSEFKNIFDLDREDVRKSLNELDEMKRLEDILVYGPSCNHTILLPHL